MVYLFYPLMKMHPVIVKQGFVVIVAFCYNICLLRTPVIMILNVVGCKDCTRENKLPLWGAWGHSPQPLDNSCNFFEKNIHFNTIWMTFYTF